MPFASSTTSHRTSEGHKFLDAGKGFANILDVMEGESTEEPGPATPFLLWFWEQFWDAFGMLLGGFGGLFWESKSAP